RVKAHFTVCAEAFGEEARSAVQRGLDRRKVAVIFRRDLRGNADGDDGGVGLKVRLKGISQLHQRETADLGGLEEILATGSMERLRSGTEVGKSNGVHKAIKGTVGSASVLG